MKILWLCNIRFSEQATKQTGTWLQPLAEMINNTEGYEVVNVNFSNGSGTCEEVVNGIRQFLLPKEKSSFFAHFCHNKWLKVVGKELKKIVDEERPDLVQIWGTEGEWSTLYRMGYIKAPAFIEMQGVMRTCFEYFYGGLSNKQILQCALAPQSFYKFPHYTIWWIRRSFKLRSKEEVKNLRSFDKISVQSHWVEGYVRSINPKASIFNTHIILREPFYHCKLWHFRPVGDSPVVFTSSSGSHTYKGLHVLLHAVAELKQRYPHICLNIGGSVLGIHGRLLDTGYNRFLLNLIDKLDLNDNARFIGTLSADQIIEQLQLSNVCVVPSFVESYGMALAEAMMVGVPCVASYAGAMPELAFDKQEALFYNSSDYVSCAERISDCLSNPQLAQTLSHNSHARKMKDCDKAQMLKTQLDNYANILE